MIMLPEQQPLGDQLSSGDLVEIAEKLAQTAWKAEQLQGVAAVTAGLLSGVNGLEQFRAASELPALVYHLTEWE